MTVTSDENTKRLVEELYRTEGKAEIMGGEVVRLPYSGMLPSHAAGAIMYRLGDEEGRIDGRVYTSTVAFLIDLPHRKSLSPDVSWYVGLRWGMKFPEGPPVFAAEIRESDDYGPAAEREMAAKRADYFAAGTKVVWDVDLLSEDIVRVYRAESPDRPTIYRRDETAEAERAVPGWKFAVNELFD